MTKSRQRGGVRHPQATRGKAIKALLIDIFRVRRDRTSDPMTTRWLTIKEIDDALKRHVTTNSSTFEYRRDNFREVINRALRQGGLWQKRRVQPRRDSSLMEYRYVGP